VTTAQVEAWVSTWKGSLDKARCDHDASFADAAFGRMMLHRRLAVAASVVGAFLARVGGGSAAYMDGGASRAALRDDADERAIAAEAGDLVARWYGASPAFLFERALLRQAEGRSGDALSDLKRVVAAYPAFVAAAIAAGRMALEAGDPVEAIHLLAVVERELTHTCAGAAAMADAARAIGLHEAASRYDLLALTCHGAHDSRGNDCVPFGLTGEIADDGRMSQTLYIEAQADDTVICNAGGIYYLIHPLVGFIMTAWTNPRPLSVTRSLGPSGATRRLQNNAQMAPVPPARLRSLGDYFPKTSGKVQHQWTRIAPLVGGVRRSATLPLRVDLAFGLLLHAAYRRLPTPIRRSLNEIAQTQFAKLRPMTTGLRPVLRNSIGPVFGPRGNWGIFSRVSDPHAYAELARARYKFGVARVFDLPLPGQSDATKPGAAKLSLRPLFRNAEPSFGNVPWKMPPPGVLPPAAERALNYLMSEAAICRIAPPQS
jgi:hypothetical protein